MNLLQNPRSLKKVWYFISKNQPCLWTFQSTQELSWSHSQSVSSSVGITNSCSLLAFPFSQDEICYARSVSSLSSGQYTAVSLRGTYMHTHCYLLLQNNSLLDTGIIQPVAGKQHLPLETAAITTADWLSLLLQNCTSSASIVFSYEHHSNRVIPHCECKLFSYLSGSAHSNTKQQQLQLCRVAHVEIHVTILGEGLKRSTI